MSSTDYTTGYTRQDFTCADTYAANGTNAYIGDEVTGGWQLKRDNVNWGSTLTYTYSSGVGVWSLTGYGVTYSNGRIGVYSDPTNNGGTKEFDFLESDAFASSTSTEGVATMDDAEGNLSNNPGFQEMDVSISALSPFGSGYTYKLLKDNVAVDTRQLADSSERNYTIDYSSLGQYGVWDLTVTEVSTLTIKHLRRLTLSDPSIINIKKKVFCNFW